MPSHIGAANTFVTHSLQQTASEVYIKSEIAQENIFHFIDVAWIYVQQQQNTILYGMQV